MAHICKKGRLRLICLLGTFPIPAEISSKPVYRNERSNRCDNCTRRICRHESEQADFGKMNFPMGKRPENGTEIVSQGVVYEAAGRIE